MSADGTIGFRRNLFFLMEGADEVVRIGKSGSCGNFVDFQVGVFQKTACLVQLLSSEVGAGRNAELFFPVSEKIPIGHAMRTY